MCLNYDLPVHIVLSMLFSLSSSSSVSAIYYHYHNFRCKLNFSLSSKVYGQIIGTQKVFLKKILRMC